MPESFNEKIERKVIGIEFSSEDGKVTYVEIYEDGTESERQKTDIETNNEGRLRALRQELISMYGDDVKI